MKKSHKILTIILFSCIEYIGAQTFPTPIEHSELLRYKIDEDRFTFGWLNNPFSRIPCFRDYTQDNTEMNLIDPKTDSIIYTSVEPTMNGLKILPDQIILDKSTKRLKIVGKITGGWESVIPVEFQIYIGHRNDTISNITLSPTLHGDVYYNGEKLTGTVIINTVPAFYLSKIQKFNVVRGEQNLANSTYKEMIFDIDGIIDDKSILVFGLSSRYAEIFEVGKLLSD